MSTSKYRDKGQRDTQGGSNMTWTDFFCSHNWQLLAHVSLQRTPLTRAGGRVEVVASLSRSHSCCAVRLVYTQISPGHIWTLLYVTWMSVQLPHCTETNRPTKIMMDGNHAHAWLSCTSYMVKKGFFLCLWSHLLCFTSLKKDTWSAERSRRSLQVNKFQYRPTAQMPPEGQGLIIIDTSRSQSDMPQLVGLLWTSDQPDAETSNWQHITQRTSMPLRGIRNCNPSMRVAADPRFSPRGHWNRLISVHLCAFVGSVILLRVY